MSEISVERIHDDSWMIRGPGCYAVVRRDGSHKTYTLKATPAPDDFKIVVAAMADWCMLNPTVTIKVD